MSVVFNIYICLLWLFLGLLSFFISMIIQRWEKQIRDISMTAKSPSWGSVFFRNCNDPYCTFFRVGGIVLVILSIPVGFVSSHTGLDIAIWVSIICYFSISNFIIIKRH